MIFEGFNSLLLNMANMAIEIVDLPTKNGDFQQLCKGLPEGIYGKNAEELLVDYFLP
jgi:hypothetical protein